MEHDEVVMEYITKNGVTVRFHDEAYFGKTDDELERIKENARRTAWWCVARLVEREQATQCKPETDLEKKKKNEAGKRTYINEEADFDQ